MKIFKQEIIDGLAEKIKATASIAYCIQLEPNKDVQFNEAVFKAVAAKLSSKEGLYPTKSILVSTVWNKNDDVFDKGEVWMAKSTPEDKPTNLEHDEKKIVGHITGNWPITEAGELIPDDTPIDELPDKYHVLNSAVIYTLWQDKDLSERTATLIGQIEAGEKFVSMECVFMGFDYAVIAPDKTFHVVARNSETAFLTKHLRAYGGTGEYQGHRVGRLLRNITFSGKGYVDKPANPDSVILKGEDFSFSSAKENNLFSSNNGVIFLDTHMEKNNMSEVLDKQIAELTKKVADLQNSLDKSTSDLKVSNDKIAELTKNLETSAKELTTTKEDLKKVTEDSVKAAEEAKKAFDTVSSELATVRASELKARRVSKLVDGGVAKEDAEKKVDSFAALKDDQFDIVAEALVAAVKKVETTTEEVDIDEDKAAANLETDATKVVDKTNAGVVVNSPTVDDKKLETARAGISKWFSSKLGLKDE